MDCKLTINQYNLIKRDDNQETPLFYSLGKECYPGSVVDSLGRIDEGELLDTLDLDLFVQLILREGVVPDNNLGDNSA